MATVTLPKSFNEVFALPDTKAIALALRHIPPTEYAFGQLAGRVLVPVAELNRSLKLMRDEDGAKSIAASPQVLAFAQDCKIHIAEELGFDGNSGSA